IPFYLFGIHIEVDHAIFKLPGDTLVYAEIFYSIERSELPFKRLADNSFRADFTLYFELLGLDKTIIDTATFPLAVSIKDSEEINKPYYIYDYLGVAIQPGTYIYNLFLKFDSPQYNATLTDTIVATQFGKEDISISDILLAASVTDAITPGPFVKYGKKILPNPSRIYNEDIPVAYYYAEIYRNISDKSEYKGEIQIYDKNGKLIRGFELGEITWVEDKSIIINGFSVAGLKTGEYTLNLVVKNDRLKSFTKKKNFYVIRKSDKSVIEKNLEIERQKMYYFATSSELSLFDKLEPIGKVEFIKSFWEKRKGMSKATIDERYSYVNSRFSTRKFREPDGWKTDQGRIYILYGPPDNIERHDMTMQSNQWEKWEYYHVDKGIYFIFADIYNIGEMKLIHSNAKGEIYDENWMKKITRNPSYFPEGE
ncbi:MAG: GWxTD domain-containing protein, partial [bacterium]